MPLLPLRNNNPDKYYPVPEPTITPAIKPAEAVAAKPKVSRPVITKDDPSMPPTVWSKAKVINPLQTMVDTQPAVNPVKPEPTVAPKVEEAPVNLSALEQVTGFTPEVPLKSTGFKDKAEIMQIQQKLRDAGHDLGKYGAKGDGVDGIVGSRTKAAIDSYNSNISTPGITFTPPERYGVGARDVKEDQCATYALAEINRISNTKLSDDEFAKKTGLGTDAWNISKSVIARGGELVEDRLAGKFGQPKVGDVVSIYTGGSSDFQGAADKEGDGNSHTGFITKVWDGGYEIDHNVHQSEVDDKNNFVFDEKGKKKYKGKAYRNTVDADGNISGWEGMQVRKITRPNYSALATRPSVYDKDIQLVDNTKDPVASEIVTMFNTNKKKFADKFKLDEDENIALAKAALGIINQESKFGKAFQEEALRAQAASTLLLPPGIKDVASKVIGTNTQKLREGATEIYKKAKSAILPGDEYGKNEETSKGLGRIKYQMNFSPEEIKYLQSEFGLDKPDDAKGSFVFTLAILNKNYSKFLGEGKSKEEALYRAIAQHNSPSKAKSVGQYAPGTGKDYAANYDIDFTNKVIQHSLKFPVTKGGKQLGSLMEKLATNDMVAANTAKIKSLAHKTDITQPKLASVERPKVIKRARKGGIINPHKQQYKIDYAKKL